MLDLLAAAVLFAVPQHAESDVLLMSGYELELYCSTQPDDPNWATSQFHCFGVIKGTHGANRLGIKPGEGPFPYCIPSIPPTQIRQKILDFIAERPSVRELPASDIVLLTFVSTFPCPDR